MKVLVIHNSDEVKACFVGEDEKDILEKLKSSIYWEDVTNRLVDESLDEEDLGGWQVRNEDDISIERITGYLYHDGDSTDGYTLFDSQ